MTRKVPVKTNALHPQTENLDLPNAIHMTPTKEKNTHDQAPTLTEIDLVHMTGPILENRIDKHCPTDIQDSLTLIKVGVKVLLTDTWTARGMYVKVDLKGTWTHIHVGVKVNRKSTWTTHGVELKVILNNTWTLLIIGPRAKEKDAWGTLIGVGVKRLLIEIGNRHGERTTGH